jgi:hypothetical protein
MASGKKSDTGSDNSNLTPMLTTGSSGHKKASSNLVSTFMQAKHRQATEILDEIGDNIELQLIVKQTILEYRANEQSAKDAGMTLAECVAKTVRGRKRTRDDDDDNHETADEETTNFEGTLRRGQLVFGSWSEKLMDELFQYCDPRVASKETLSMLKKATKQEMMETGLDLILFGDQQDRVGTDDKQKLFDALKKVYISSGMRWRHLQVDMENGLIVYENAAPWMVIATQAEPLVVKLKLNDWANFGTAVEISDDLCCWRLVTTTFA